MVLPRGDIAFVGILVYLFGPNIVLPAVIVISFKKFLVKDSLSPLETYRASVICIIQMLGYSKYFMVIENLLLCQGYMIFY